VKRVRYLTLIALSLSLSLALGVHVASAQIEEGDVDESYNSYGQDRDEEIEYDNALTPEAKAAQAEQKITLGTAEIDSLLEGIRWFGHASFLIEAGKNIWIDPYNLPEKAPQADIILVTHDHRDHYSPGDMKRILKPSTVVVSIKAVTEKLSKDIKHTRVVKAGDTLTVEGIHIEVVPAYNIGKDFHPREKGYVGYIVHVDGRTIYHAGDTDNIPEMKRIRPDVALLPAGGTYTMDAVEAAKAAEALEAGVAIPMHWGTIVGSIEDARLFKTTCKVPVVILEVETMKPEPEKPEPEKQ
jgi:L-ascorbate metabolism protein UlaG (beta-lactamase superfamily)